MRQTALKRMIGLAALSCALAGVGAAGCRSAVADFYDPLTSGTSTGGTGGSGGLPVDCQGDPTADPSIVRDDVALEIPPERRPRQSVRHVVRTDHHLRAPPARRTTRRRCSTSVLRSWWVGCCR